jgi:chromosomal replication initiation ATPase DnaA
METEDQVLEDRWRASLALSLACYALGIPPEKVAVRARNKRAALARIAAMYLARVAFNMSATRVGSAFGRDRSTVSHACRQMEDWRDEPDFDRWVEALELSAEAAPGPYRGRPA